MQIVVEVPDEFAAQVEARGVSPKSFVQDAVDDAVRTAPFPVPVRGRMKMDEFIQNMAANSEKIPQLPDEAFTRESFYRNHD